MNEIFSHNDIKGFPWEKMQCGHQATRVANGAKWQKQTCLPQMNKTIDIKPWIYSREIQNDRETQDYILSTASL